MTILSNDYASNLPIPTKIAHGGPANFASAFSEYVEKKGTPGWESFARTAAFPP